MAKVDVKGDRELIRAFRNCDEDTQKGIADDLKGLGRIVQDDARGRMPRYSQRTAMGIRFRVRRKLEVSIEQRRGRTTGARPDWGAFNMRRALVPAVASNEDEVVQRVENTINIIGRANGF